MEAMTDDQLRELIGETPEQEAETSRKLAHLSEETLQAAADGNPAALRKFLTALHGPDKRKWPK